MELLVAMVLSIILTTGVYTTLISNQSAYEAVRSSQTLTNKKWVLTSLIRTFVRHAGWLPLEYLEDKIEGNLWLKIESSDALYWQLPDFYSVDNAYNIIGNDNANEIVDDGLTNSDIVAFPLFGTNTDYELNSASKLSEEDRSKESSQNTSTSRDGLVKCNGQNIEANSSGILISFYVNNSNQLICHDSDSGSVVIDNNIDQMQVLYGVQNGGYITATTLNDNKEMNIATPINRIKVALLISEEIIRNKDIIANTQSYELFGQKIKIEPDNYYREVVTETILFRNPIL